MTAQSRTNSSRPVVSVIVPAFNSARFVIETLQSVRWQTYRPIELIVVDDQSTDNTRELVTCWAGEIQDAEFVVRLLRNPRKGAIAARNFGMQQAGGEFLQYLDHDDLLHKDKLRVQVDQSLVEDADLVVSRNRPFQERTEIACILAKDVEYLPLSELHIPEPYYARMRWSLLAWLIRRDLMMRVGLWNETIGMTDYEMDTRLKLAARRVAYTNALLSFWCTATPNSDSKGPARKILGWRDEVARVVCQHLVSHGIRDPQEYFHLSRFAGVTSRRWLRMLRPMAAMQSLAQAAGLAMRGCAYWSTGRPAQEYSASVDSDSGN